MGVRDPEHMSDKSVFAWIRDETPEIARDKIQGVLTL
jgi:hypothetical protein